MAQTKSVNHSLVCIQPTVQCWSEERQTYHMPVARNRTRLSSVHVAKVSPPPNKQENVIWPWYNLRRRRQSFVSRKAIRDPMVHVQRINPASTSQERIITPSSHRYPTSLIHTFNNSHSRSLEVKSVLEYCIFNGTVLAKEIFAQGILHSIQ